MAVFYAYVHNVLDMSAWRILIVFASPAVADEWWEAISTGTVPVLSQHVKRISPVLYMHHATQCNLFNFFVDGRFKPVAERFRGRMFLTLENDFGGRGMSVVPSPFVDQHPFSTSGDLDSIHSSPGTTPPRTPPQSPKLELLHPNSP